MWFAFIHTQCTHKHVYTPNSMHKLCTCIIMIIIHGIRSKGTGAHTHPTNFHNEHNSIAIIIVVVGGGVVGVVAAIHCRSPNHRTAPYRIKLWPPSQCHMWVPVCTYGLLKTSGARTFTCDTLAHYTDYNKSIHMRNHKCLWLHYVFYVYKDIHIDRKCMHKIFVVARCAMPSAYLFWCDT